jgi:flagellin
MALSVHTNAAALTALQNLNKTNEQLGEVQSRINTGLAINNAKDNAAVWSIAQGQRADIGALSAVKMSLDRAKSIADVAMSAGESVSDLLVQLKEKVLTAMDPSLSTQSRNSVNSDYKAILRQIGQVVENSTFDGANILDDSIIGGIRFLANAEANAYITLTSQNMMMGSGIITLTAASSIGTAALANAAMTALTDSISNVNQALGDMGSQAKQIENHNKFVQKLRDMLEAGVGNLVDADLAKDSARLQALQVKQQLGTQALSIANQSPQILLSLFKG